MNTNPTNTGRHKEDALARLARIASRATRSPLASISLTREYHSRCTPSTLIENAVYKCESSLAAWVLFGGKALIIDDLSSHDQLSTHKDVVDLGVRAFAGVPITGPGGVVIGCISVRDTRPRRFGTEELETLSALAEVASRDLEVRGIDSGLSTTETSKSVWAPLAGCSILVAGEFLNWNARQILERYGAVVRECDDHDTAFSMAVGSVWDVIIVAVSAEMRALPVKLRGAGVKAPMVGVVTEADQVKPSIDEYDEVVLCPLEDAALVSLCVHVIINTSDHGR